MKRDEGLYRALRFIKLTALGLACMAVAVVVIGYMFLMRTVDPTTAYGDASRELRTTVLHYGEPAVRIARVYRRRPTNYFRAANGLLVATPDRLLFVGVEPRDKLAGEDAPAALITSEFRNDTLLSIIPGRVYSFTAHGATVRRGRVREEFASARGYGDELDSLAAYVQRSHVLQRRAVAADRELHAEIAALVKRPLRYVVKRGDAISTIANRFGTTPADIRTWNHMTSDRVRIRDTLTVKPAG